jgi:hypothetical protein
MSRDVHLMVIAQSTTSVGSSTKNTKQTAKQLGLVICLLYLAHPRLEKLGKRAQQKFRPIVKFARRLHIVERRRCTPLWR